MVEHLSLPLRVTPSGRMAGNEQDSARDIAESLALLFATRPGERRSVPGYGSPELLFATRPQVDGLVAAATDWEERADPMTLSLTVSSAVAEVLATRQRRRSDNQDPDTSAPGALGEAVDLVSYLITEEI